MRINSELAGLSIVVVYDGTCWPRCWLEIDFREFLSTNSRITSTSHLLYLPSSLISELIGRIILRPKREIQSVLLKSDVKSDEGAAINIPQFLSIFSSHYSVSLCNNDHHLHWEMHTLLRFVLPCIWLVKKKCSRDAVITVALSDIILNCKALLNAARFIITCGATQ